MNHKLIGRRIAEVRELRGISQSELARELGVKPQAVQKWEAGGAPRTHRIEAIANALGISARSLVGGDETDSEAAGAGWPFARISRKEFDALPLEAKIDIEDYIQMKVSKARAPKGKQNKTAASS